MTEEEKRIEIRDSVVMGDVNQHVLNAECPSCSTSNVKVMKCQEIQCGKRFCELCHPECRYSKGNSFRFDSGKGLGPFCRKCITAKRKEAERVVRERAEKERKREEEKRRVREQVARVREREERERVQIKHRKEKEKERKREEAGIVQRTREAKKRGERTREEAGIVQRTREAKKRGERTREERERSQREGDEKDSSLWKEAADHSSSRNKVYRKRLMYSLILGFLVGVLHEWARLRGIEDSEMMIGGFVMVTLCCFYPLYLITMIIICGQTGTRKHYVKLSNQSNRMHKYTEMVDELSFLTVAELRDKLSDVGLPVDTNKKADLITRLADYEKMMLWKEGLL